LRSLLGVKRTSPIDGKPPEVMTFGSAWQGANFELIDKTTEIAPGIILIALVSDAPGTRELKELSLAINTPDGIVLVVGCSHPGIDKIVEAAATINPKIHLITGGFHLVAASDDAISRIVATLKDTFKVESIAPGHCERSGWLMASNRRRSVSPDGVLISCERENQIDGCCAMQGLLRVNVGLTKFRHDPRIAGVDGKRIDLRLPAARLAAIIRSNLSVL
jgi:hypothetical protein